MPAGPLLGRRRATVPTAVVLCLVAVVGTSAAVLDPGAAGRTREQPPAAHLPAPPGTTSRVSVSTQGIEALALSGDAAISGDGRWVAFTSIAGNLVRGDTNGAAEIFVRDLQNGVTERLPVVGGFVAPRGQAAEPSISENGDFVAFRYQAPVIGTLDGPTPDRILLWQRGVGTIEVAPDPQGPRDVRLQPAISSDGTWIAFTAERYVEGQFRSSEVFGWNRLTGNITLVSANVRGGASGGRSSSPSVSRDGAYIAFQSNATLLDANDANPGTDIFVRDMTAGTTRGITIAPPTGPAGAVVPADSDSPVISGDGQYVSYATTAAFAPEDGNRQSDIYRWDRNTNQHTLVSIGIENVAAAGSSGQPSMSADGRYVAFASTAPDVIPASADAPATTPPPGQQAAILRGASEIYLRDLSVPETIRASVTRDGLPAGRALRPSVSNDGSRVVFDADGENLVRNDTNKALDVFLRDLPPVLEAAPNPVDFGSQPVNQVAPVSILNVTNRGWADLRVTGIAIAGTNPVDFDAPVDQCTGRSVRRGEACQVTLTYRPSAEGARSAELRIAHVGDASPFPVPLKGTATNARLEVQPRVGPPGTVVIAEGKGFPANSTVRLSWLRGITPPLQPIVADAAGAFRVQVLVYHNDLQGPRLLRAEPVNEPCFPSVDTEFLVVQHSAQPPTRQGPFPLGPWTLIHSVPNVSVVAPPPPPITCAGPVIIFPTPTPTPPPTPAPVSTPTPTPTPVPTAPPDTSAPTLSGLTANPPGINVDPFCGNVTTITVSASDPAGVFGVTLWYDPPVGSYASKPMTRISGTAFSGTWQTTLTAQASWGSGDMPYYVVATDWLGNSRDYPPLILGRPKIAIYGSCIR